MNDALPNLDKLQAMQDRQLNELLVNLKAQELLQNGPRELTTEPLNRVLIVDKNTNLGQDRYHDKFTHELWMQMNLVIFVDYAENTFYVAKNRWGRPNVTLPVALLGPFLFHPEITSEDELIAEMECLANESI